jgi:MerR family transcriptional regulator, light-induced transcriptional regulator
LLKLCLKRFFKLYKNVSNLIKQGIDIVNEAFILASMNYFTIKDIENLSGIKAHTLRIWERRYQFLNTSRKESGHRYYTDEDLKHLLRISSLYHTGVRISDIDRMSAEEIRELVYVKGKTNSYTPMINLLLESCIDLNDETFMEVLRHSILQLGFETALKQVAYPLLQKIGNLWLTDHLRPVQEHFASSRIRNEIVSNIDKLPAPGGGNPWNFLIFTPEGEEHEIPVLLGHYMARKNGWAVTYAGTNVSNDVLKAIVGRKTITHLYFHIITNLTNSRFEDYIAQLTQQFPNLPVICSGPAVTPMNALKQQVFTLQDMADFESVCKNPAAFTTSQEHMHPRRRA